ncbi:MAG: DUF4367 domain-containing protein [Clostridia bacterium]|nr:DUF4367 domain-containing protein [Clostridia bacterium]
MDNKEWTGLTRLEEALRQYDAIYLKRHPPLGRSYERSRPKSAHIPLRRGLALLAATLILFGSALSVSAVRESAARLIVRVYDAFVELFADQQDLVDPPTSIETVYTLSYVPSGFEPYRSNVGEYEVKQIWKNDSDDLLVFTQLPLHAKSTLDHEEVHIQAFYIGATKITYYEKHGICCFYWQTEDYIFTLNLPTHAVSKAKARTIIESVTTNEERIGSK